MTGLAKARRKAAKSPAPKPPTYVNETFARVGGATVILWPRRNGWAKVNVDLYNRPQRLTPALHLALCGPMRRTPPADYSSWTPPMYMGMNECVRLAEAELIARRIVEILEDADAPRATPSDQ